MAHFPLSPALLKSFVPYLFLIVLWPQGAATAQIVPDNTLPGENSILPSEAETRTRADVVIRGGAQRDTTLFHSFEQFNVNPGQQVRFANPSLVERILSRVTGGQRSIIDGLLGVDGAANLFLLNPNGILFGPGAELDIRGAFTASTADTFQFEGATAPVDIQGSDFLTMSVPLGVQRGMQPQGNISSNGNLETGQI
ncbi:MAG: filamentous hemagglutinin N-terminal domain-containing protein [Chloroflexota bacterium]